MQRTAPRLNVTTAAPGPGPWRYFGWDPARRDALAAACGRPPEPVQPLIAAAAQALRRPFLDWVAEAGRGSPDPGAWWSGTLAWKSWSASDLFLLLCYLHALRGLARAGEAGTAVLEDPWLFHEARAALGAEADFGPAPSLAAPRLRSAALGALRRGAWALRTARSLARLRGLAPLDVPTGPAVLVHSYLQDRSFEGGAFRDLYFPGLERELSEAGVEVRRTTDPDAAGFERALRALAGSVEPLARAASWRGLARALAALPPPTPPAPSLDGLRPARLLEREFWHDLSRAGRCSYAMLLEGARAVMDRAPWKALLLAWEGQPQERLLALAARERGIRVVGSQHSTVSPHQLPFLLGAGEADWAPYPDLLLTAGPQAQEILEREGVPSGRLAPGGSRRFTPPRPRPAAAGRDVLVVLPVDPLRAAHLLRAAARAAGRGPRVAVKPHPGHHAPALPPGARLEERDLPASCRDAAVVVFASTAAGLEAAALGVPVLRFRPDPLLDVDPSDVLDDDALPTCTDGDFLEKLDAQLASPRRVSPEDLGRAYARLFAPLDKAAWLRALLPGPPP